jgi:hydrogenase-4 component B
MGIYGLFRLTSFYGVIPLWWGTVVLVLALSSALLGVAFALGQHDLKRLLAYHSVENIGIILLGIAIGLIGRAVSAPYLVVMGYGGALLHVINHGLFKALLFMGAGSVIETMHTRNLESMGALSRRLPHTAAAFLIGSIAISGLPPLNGFVSELYLYIGMLKAQSLPIGMSAIAIAVAVPILAMVGALALGCFVKVYAVVFLGTARSPRCEIAAEGNWSMRLPQYVLAAACVVIGLFPRAPLTTLRQAIGELGVRAKYVVPLELTTLSYLNLALLVLLVVGFFAFRRRGIATATVPTWDCGYVAPAARMQYSASSIAADMVDLFAALLRPRIKPVAIDGVWPKRTRFESHVPEVVLELAVFPVLRGIVRAAGCVRFMQRGTAHLYLLYVLLTLLIMLAVWR